MRRLLLSLAVFAALSAGAPARAHFGMIIPSTDTVTEKKNADLDLTVSFSHPAEKKGMRMEKPRAFFVSGPGGREDLLGLLREKPVMGAPGFAAAYAVKRPGVYAFGLDPAPYFEPAEDCFILHQVKTVVAAFGEEEGWEKPLGLRAEIAPLTRPFANYAGNVFQGRVLFEGKPVAGAVVEVEALGGAEKTPNEYFVTQTVLTDEDGVFTYAVPWEGWWGFAALMEAPETLEHDGAKKPVELGAVLWAQFAAPRKK